MTVSSMFKKVDESELVRTRTSTVSEPIVTAFIAENEHTLELVAIESDKVDSMQQTLNSYINTNRIPVRVLTRSIQNGTEDPTKKLFLRRLDLDEEGEPKEFSWTKYEKTRKRSKGDVKESVDVDIKHEAQVSS